MTSGKAKKRIAIVGCGYVGCALGESLVRSGHDVVGTTATKARVKEIESASIRSAVLEHAQTDKLRALLQDRDAVFLTVAAGRRRGNYREVYLEGATNLLRAAEGTPVTRIIYTSSTGVYAQSDGSWVDESSPTEPLEDNARILLQTEQALLEGTSELAKTARVHVTTVRLGAIYGPGRDLGERIRASAGTERSDGDAYINMIHRDDIVTALTLLIDIEHHGVLNLCNDEPLTRRKLYDTVIAAANLTPIRWIQSVSSPNLGKRVRNDLIKQALGLTLQHPAFS